MPISISRFGSFVLLMSAAFLLLPGCSGKKKSGPVKGTVTLDGKEVPAGQISIIPEKGQGGGNTEIDNGAFSFTKVTMGPVKVTVRGFTAAEKTDRIRTLQQEIQRNQMLLDQLKNMPKDKGDAPDASKIQADFDKAKEDLAKVQSQKTVDIPKKYAEEKTTPLSFTLKPGEDLTVELSSK